MSIVATLLALVQLVASGLPVVSFNPVAIVALIAVALIALAVTLVGERTPVGVLPLVNLPLVVLAAYVVARTGSGNGAMLAYVLPTIWVGCFYNRQHMMLTVGAIAAIQALALLAFDTRPPELVEWLELTASLIAEAVLTTIVVENHRNVLSLRETEALVDPLTGLLNRRGLHERAVVELARARRAGEVVSLITLDIDRFKQINDTYGHDYGDEVLVRLAEVLDGEVRTIDVVARTGGEEFVLLLPSCRVEDACAVADRVRAEFSHHRIGNKVWATVSAGVTTRREPIELRPMLLAADRALYAAKAAGRDCTRVDVKLEGEPIRPPASQLSVRC